MTEKPHQEAITEKTNQIKDTFFERVTSGEVMSPVIPTKDAVGEGIAEEHILLFDGKIIATREEIDVERNAQRQ